MSFSFFLTHLCITIIIHSDLLLWWAEIILAAPFVHEIIYQGQNNVIRATLFSDHHDHFTIPKNFSTFIICNHVSPVFQNLLYVFSFTHPLWLPKIWWAKMCPFQHAWWTPSLSQLCYFMKLPPPVPFVVSEVSHFCFSISQYFHKRLRVKCNETVVRKLFWKQQTLV